MGGTPKDMELAMIEEEVRELHPDAQARYFKVIAEGTSPRMAIMLATQQPTIQLNSDRMLNETQRRRMNRMNPMNRDAIVKIAEKAGIRTNGKYYVGGFGSYNDPHAWVSTYDDALDVCRKKNLTATGIVNHQGTPQEPVRKQIADDIVQDYVRKELASDPNLRESVKKNPKKLGEVKEKVVATHSKKRK